MRTPLEQLWHDILENAGIQFTEQTDIGPYQADFIIGDIDLEIDGLQHRMDSRHRKHDAKRDDYFRKKGYRVIRIPMNFHRFGSRRQQERLSKDIDMVMSAIDKEFLEKIN